ncbi:MAG: MFS transporter [Chlorobiaceae bacterium]|nr:MFS transporter [Chlorobiaceae bacterium]
MVSANGRPVNANDGSIYAKAAFRLIPILFFSYILAYLDRVNVGFAKLQMCSDLGLSETAYGTGAGIFFIGYLIFEIPSNIILAKTGARVWIGRIMITWGIIALLQVFVVDEGTFYLLRFLLGVAEAGFFPGIILYLTYWFPAEYRARMVAWFMTAIAVAGVIGGPISGWILHSTDGYSGMPGWRWLFLLEGFPSIVMGMVVLFYLDNSPKEASWLSSEEKEMLSKRAAIEESERLAQGTASHSVRAAFRNPKVWIFSLIYFAIVLGLYGISFWLPQIIKETITPDEKAIGWISAIPWSFAAAAMVVNGIHSDRTGERKWHIAAPCIAASAAFAVSAMHSVTGWSGIITLCIATAGIMSALSCFWSMPSGILAGTAAAAGIALINSFGNTAGYVSPELVGIIRDATGHSMTPVLYLFSISLLTAALLVLLISRKQTNGKQT